MPNLVELLLNNPETSEQILREAYLLGIAEGRRLEADDIRNRVTAALAVHEPLFGKFALSDSYAKAIGPREAPSGPPGA
jgi:hypothetical protein